MTTNETPSRNDRAGKYLTFRLSKNEYGIEVARIIEIISMMNITDVPEMPVSYKGIVNLRGRVIPLMDVRLTLHHLASKEYDNAICIIIVEFDRNNTRLQVGLIVDSVSVVIAFSGDDIEEQPKIAGMPDTSCILGFAKGNGSIRLLLDIDRIISRDTIGTIIKNAS